MPKYRYTVINPENKQLTGTIGAPDEQSARQELNQLGFSILSIDQIDEQEAQNTQAEEKAIPKFEFTAIDKNLKHISGTIQAQDRYAAYKRLVKEYLFEVETLVDSNASEEEKNLQRQKGVYELQNQLDSEELAQKKKDKKEDFDFESFDEQQKILQQQVEFVLKKVKEILDIYGDEIKGETKEKIRRYVDKILRIKNSTNLDYIKKSCEELLIFLQKEEIFLHEEQRQKEHAKLSLEAKSMMARLNRRKAQTLSFSERLRKWREEHITKADQPSFIDRFLNIFVILIIGAGEPSPEIKEITEKIATLNDQLKQYFIIYFQAANQDIKLEAQDAIKRLFQERKKLKKDLALAKKQIKIARRRSPQKSFFEKFMLDVHAFSGWLLMFYLFYYFTTFFLTQKKIFNLELLQVTSFYDSIFLKYFIVIFFLFYSSLSIKITFFRQNAVASFIIVPVFGLSALLILLNF